MSYVEQLKEAARTYDDMVQAAKKHGLVIIHDEMMGPPEKVQAAIKEAREMTARRRKRQAKERPPIIIADDLVHDAEFTAEQRRKILDWYTQPMGTVTGRLTSHKPPFREKLRIPIPDIDFAQVERRLLAQMGIEGEMLAAREYIDSAPTPEERQARKTEFFHRIYGLKP